jgi:propionyl-CoA synthetase
VTASCGIEPGRIIEYKPLVDQAIAMSPHQPQTCFVVQRPMARAEMTAGRDRDFHEALTADPADYVPVRATDPLYVLYTSGTTGKPKGIVRDNGGHATALLQTMQLIYGAAAGDTVWAASDIGWVVGHSYIVYGPLLAGCTTVLYEGKPVKTPDAGAFWRVCAHHGVKNLFTAPTAIRAIRQEDVRGDHARQWDLSRLRTIFLAGERCDPPTADWLRAVSGKRVIDHWWQTETGWPITAGFAGLDCPAQAAGSAGRPAPGWHLSALDNDGSEVPAGETGALMIKLPLPPGAATTLER